MKHTQHGVVFVPEHVDVWDGDVVDKADYDKLLELYRQAKDSLKRIEEYINEIAT